MKLFFNDTKPFDSHSCHNAINPEAEKEEKKSDFSFH